MATESVAEMGAMAFGPKAFAQFDSSVYMTWISGIAELMILCGKDSLPGKTTSDLGYLIQTLVEGANELNERDRLESKEGTK